MPSPKEQVQKKLFSPLKNALLAAAVSIAPETLTRASEQALDHALTQISEKIGDNVQKNLEQNLENFGTKEHTEQSNPSEKAGPQNFQEPDKSDIMDKNQNPEPPNAKKPESPDEKNTQTPPEQGDQKKPYQQFSEEDPEKPSETEEKNSSEQNENQQKEQQEEEEEDQEPEPEVQQRNTAMQALNALRYRRQISGLKRQLQQKQKQLKPLQAAHKSISRQIQILKIQKAPLVMAKLFLGMFSKMFLIFNWSLGCCIFFWIVEVTYTIKKIIDRLIKILKQHIELLEQQIKTLTEKRTEIEKQMKKIQQEARQIEIQIMMLYNRGLLERQSADEVYGAGTPGVTKEKK